MRYGLSDYEIERIIRHSLNKNPDLKYYINNDYIDELINLIVSGVSRAIVENTEKVVSDLERELRRKNRGIL